MHVFMHTLNTNSIKYMNTRNVKYIQDMYTHFIFVANSLKFTHHTTHLVYRLLTVY